MDGFLTDVLLLVALTLVNGLFAMSEIALVSSRKVRLQNLSDKGNSGARKALELVRFPSRFLSTIQVGITSIGILSGAIGEKVLSAPLAKWIAEVQPYAHGIALTLTVIALTYFTVVIGELVPKSLALLAPERWASLMARPLSWVAFVSRPLVLLLARSSEWLLEAFGVKKDNEPPVSDNEIRALMVQGTRAGVFHESEEEIVSNVLRLDQQPVMEIMTPRHDMAIIDLNDSIEKVRNRIVESDHTRLVVCKNGLQHVLGILRTGDLLKKTVNGNAVTFEDIRHVLRSPAYVPEAVSTIQLMENFRRSNNSFALIVDEYGEVQRVVTLTDVLAAIVGDYSSPEITAENDLVQRGDGSWLADGEMSMERLTDELGIKGTLPGEETHRFHTVGGFVMYMLGKIPAPADSFEIDGWRFEVMDMDKNRVDKVLVSKVEVREDGFDDELS